MLCVGVHLDQADTSLSGQAFVQWRVRFWLGWGIVFSLAGDAALMRVDLTFLFLSIVNEQVGLTLYFLIILGLFLLELLRLGLILDWRLESHFEYFRGGRLRSLQSHGAEHANTLLKLLNISQRLQDLFKPNTTSLSLTSI